jgi:hypothetical protein
MNYEEKLIKEYNKQKHKEEVKSGHDIVFCQNSSKKKQNYITGWLFFFVYYTLFFLFFEYLWNCCGSCFSLF